MRLMLWNTKGRKVVNRMAVWSHSSYTWEYIPPLVLLLVVLLLTQHYCGKLSFLFFYDGDTILVHTVQIHHTDTDSL